MTDRTAALSAARPIGAAEIGPRRVAADRQSAGLARAAARRTVYSVLGVAVLIGLWWLGGLAIYLDPATRSFASLAPVPTFRALLVMLGNGEIARAAAASLERVVGGLACAIVLGLPLGIAVGRSAAFREATYLPFQFLRMISPLSWMPIAVLAFPTWNQAIVFLIAAASIWPVTFATANGLSKVDPAWFKVARNLGARSWHMLFQIILPAIAQDVFTGIRLALGVAWIVLVPAEFLGVTSGLGYAINDARDTLDYSHLGALVVVIGVIGFSLDAVCLWLIRRYGWAREK